MSHSEAIGSVGEATWRGGASPYAVGHKKLGMWLFIVSDALTFSALIVAYSYVRMANDWPKPFDFYPAIIFSSVMTLVLLSSSLTMVFGVAAGHAGDRKAAAKWLLATMVVVFPPFFGVDDTVNLARTTTRSPETWMSSTVLRTSASLASRNLFSRSRIASFPWITERF